MKQPKAQYSELEAARELGLSLEQFRTLIRQHLIEREEDLANLPVATYQPSDLVLLRLLSRGMRQSTP